MNKEQLLFDSGWTKDQTTGAYYRHETAQEIQRSATGWQLITHGRRGGKSVKRFTTLATIISQPGILSPEAARSLLGTVRAI